MCESVFDRKRTCLLCPSILSADLADLSRSLEAIGPDFDMVHCDVMDGHFVPQITFGPQLVAQLARRTDKPLDVHMMVSRPGDWVEAFAAGGAATLVFHREADDHPQRLLSRIRALGCKAGLSLNPATPLESVKWLLPDLDMLLLMTVNPGFGGQAYLPQLTEKIREARRMIDASGRFIRLQVDGGISSANVDEVLDAGADMIVAGSAIFKADDPAAAASALYRQLADHDARR